MLLEESCGCFEKMYFFGVLKRRCFDETVASLCLWAKVLRENFQREDCYFVVTMMGKKKLRWLLG